MSRKIVFAIDEINTYSDTTFVYLKRINALEWRSSFCRNLNPASRIDLNKNSTTGWLGLHV